MISRSSIILCALVAATAQVSAQPAREQADVLYGSGRALMEAGKIAEACTAFEESNQLDPALTTLIALAICRETLGQLATAWELFLEVERQTRTASGSDTAQLHQLARTRAGKLEPRVSRLAIRVPEGSKVAGLEILRDAVSVPPATWNRALPVDGGTYTITARAPGRRAWSARVTLAPEADTKTVDVPDLRTVAGSLEERPPAAPVTGPRPQPARAAVPPPEAARSHGGLAAPIAAGTGAAVLLGGALGFSLWGDSTYDDAKNERKDQARRDALVDSAERKRYAAQALAVAGAGCAGVAVWLYLRQRDARPEAPAGHARWMLAPSPSGIGVLARF